MPKHIYILNGPNLNLLGTREPEIYGTASLDDAKAGAEAEATKFGLGVVFRQSNHEGELVDWIQEARTNASGLIVNAGAYTHTSIAMRDALVAARLPVVELHLSNVFEREPFRRRSHIAPVSTGLICGFGVAGYALAVRALAEHLAGDGTG